MSSRIGTSTVEIERALQAHRSRADAIAEQVRARPPGSWLTIRKNTPGHSVRDPRYKQDCHAVDVGGLHHILHIDPVGMTATVEGQVLIGDLCRATLAYGLVPRVVPEFPDFTVAGLLCGEGLQSSSHRYGVFSDTLSDVELVLGNGSLVHATATRNGDLFTALPESLGTLGIVTSVTVQLARAAPYVCSTYRRFTTLDDYVRAFESSLERSAFHEGVVYGPREYVLVTSDFASEVAGVPEIDPHATGSPYYYQHVLAAARGRESGTDIQRTDSYFTRSARGLWWMMECHAGLPLLTGTRWGRRYIEQHTQDGLSAHGFDVQGLTVADRERCLVHQDMGVRLGRLAEAIVWVHEHLGVYPLWNCAVHLEDELALRFDTRYLVDVGIYGEPRRKAFRANRDVRALQQFVDHPALWGVSYLSWEELCATRGDAMPRYEQVRDRYAATGAFPHLRDKVTWIDPDGPAPGPIPFWRLHRSFGPRWYVRPEAYATLAIGYGSTLVWKGFAR